MVELQTDESRETYKIIVFKRFIDVPRKEISAIGMFAVFAFAGIFAV
jgi:ribosomal protein S10